jgi:hypothetical protein
MARLSELPRPSRHPAIVVTAEEMPINLPGPVTPARTFEFVPVFVSTQEFRNEL